MWCNMSSEQAPDLEDLRDADLLALAATGNNGALKVLVERHSSWILRVATDIVRDKDEAKDLGQQIFLFMLENAGQYDPERGDVRTWLFHVTRYQAISRRRYLRARQFYTNVAVEEHLKIKGPPVEAGWLRLAPPEQSYLLQELMQRLSPIRRRIIELRFFEGLSGAEVAKEIGKSVASVENHVSRGLKELKALARKLGL